MINNKFGGLTGALFIVAILLFSTFVGVHFMGGTNTPVVTSTLNSWSGWGLAVAGFMLENNLLLITGALVGASGAIILMYRRDGLSGEVAAAEGEDDTPKVVHEIKHPECAAKLAEANKILIIPGYGMAVAHAQRSVADMTKILRKKGVDVLFGIHPVAGRMPGHIRVLLTETNIPSDIIYEMHEINPETTDVSLVIGANDIVNPDALDNPNSIIKGMPVIECWRGKLTVVMKRSMASGHSNIDNPLFYKPNTRMLFGDAKESVDLLLSELGVLGVG